MRFERFTAEGCLLKWVRPLAKDGIMLWVMRPGRSIVSAGGNRLCAFRGKLCGRIAGEAVKGDMIDYDHLREYEKIWKTYGKQQNRSFALRSL